MYDTKFGPAYVHPPVSGATPPSPSTWPAAPLPTALPYDQEMESCVQPLEGVCNSWVQVFLWFRSVFRVDLSISVPV